MRTPVAAVAFILIAAPLTGCPTRAKYDGLAIAITSPVNDAYVGKTVAVTVTTVPPVDMPLSLLADGKLIGTIDPGKSFSWDTSGLAEAIPHTLVAQIDLDGEMYSNSITVKIDRTPPTITETTPAPGATNVVLRAPISLKFSEPVLPSSFRPGSLPMKNLADDSTVATTAALAADGSSATITIANPSAVTLPANLSVSPDAAITDRAGNALVPPTNGWAWQVPAYLALPPLPSQERPTIAVGADNLPAITYVKLVPAPHSSYVNQVAAAKYDGQSWDDLAFPATLAQPGTSVAFDSGGKFWVAWTEYSTPSSEVHVGSWNGSVWDTGMPVVAATAGSTPADPEILLDASGYPVVAWRETTSGQSTNTDVFVARWTGTKWDTGFGAVGLRSVTDHSLVLGGNGQPIVGFFNGLGGVSTWSGTAWKTTTYISQSSSQTSASVALDASGNPMLVSTNGEVDHLTGTGWLPAVATHIAVGASVGPMELATTSTHAPVVAWAGSADTTTPPGIAVDRWTGTAWDMRWPFTQVTSAPASFSNRPALAIDATDTIWIAWTEATQLNVYMSNF